MPWEPPMESSIAVFLRRLIDFGISPISFVCAAAQAQIRVLAGLSGNLRVNKNNDYNTYDRLVSCAPSPF